MKAVKRMLALLLVMVMLAAAMPMAAFATEGTTTTASETTATTTTTTAAPTVSISNLYIVGSNNKNYLADPSVSSSVNKYSFYLPDWMEKATLMLKSSESFTAEAEGVTFEGTGDTVTGQFELKEKKNTFTVKLKSGDKERTLTVTVYLSNIPCKLESVSLLDDGDVVESFKSDFDKAEYTFASGNTKGISLRIVPRHEQTVTVTNLTGIPAEQVTGQEPETTLTLHEVYKRYDHDLTLVEGTNVFLIRVRAGDVEIKCNLTVIVGDPLANAPTTTTSTEPTTSSTQMTAPPTEPTTAPTTEAQKPGGTTSSFPPVLWVTIGVVIAVVLGACIFMIVNMGSKDNGGDGYDGYDRQPRYPVRRNLTDYVDDDYSYAPPQQRGRPRGSYYNANSYNNYTDGYNPNPAPPPAPPAGGYGVPRQSGGDYASYGGQEYSSTGFTGDYDDGYGSGTPRGGSSSLSGFESDDDYGSGNYYGGY